MSNPIARLHSTPTEALGVLLRQSIVIGGREFVFDQPRGLDQLFKHPEVRSAFEADDYIPYWADLWPAASMLANTILKEPWAALRECDPNLTVLEIGCGLGLSGIVALSLGLPVIFSDVDEAAVQLAAHNARLNGYLDFETAAIDLRASPPQQYPVILGADVLYESRMVEPLIAFLKAGLSRNGLALIGDADRVSARPFRGRLEDEGFFVQVSICKSGTSGSQARGCVYRITRPN